MLVMMLKVTKAWWWEVVKALNREREKLTHFRSNGEDASQVKKHQLYYIWFSPCVFQKSITELRILKRCIQSSKTPT